jgi:hypothetical protein
MRTVLAFAVVVTAICAAACGGASRPADAPASQGRPDVFSAAPPYSPSAPSKSASSAHSAKGVAAPAGTACLGCHKKDGNAPAFTFAGTVYVDDARSAPNPNAEIAVDDATGAERIAHADADGNFWVAGGALALPAHAGARQPAKVLKMGSVVDNADCNGCHDAKFPITMKLPK